MMENKKSWICNSFVISAVLSGILAFVIDVLERRSFYEGLRYLYHNPLNYIVNVGIIFFMMSIVWMVRRRMFVYVFVSILWLAVGITNFVILGYRNTPFTFVDIQLAAAGLAVMDKYMSSARIVALVILIVVLIAALILFFVYGPRHKKKISYIRNLLVYLVLLGVYSLFLRFCISNEYIVTEFGNIKIAYEKYGVPYCFGITLIDNGIDRPADYGEDSVEELEQKLDQVPEQIPDEKPNIVFVQLESFFDVTHMKKLKLSEDPIPNFRSLKENYSHGFLHMPSYGAGTANSEFELITGMNRSYFGCGEYPYKSVLQKKTCESIPYALQDIGYSTHVVHNNRAQFYDRDLVFTHLGFQSFTSLECMAHTEKTYNGWTKDHVLTKEIMKSLRSTPGKDYVYTISVEGHGEYPVEKMENPEVSITGGMKDKERRNRLEHYINQTR
ncbi:MAG: LTA synthase family protein, partial [Lachnospiraceae bacterium]